MNNKQPRRHCGFHHSTGHRGHRVGCSHNVCKRQLTVARYCVAGDLRHSGQLCDLQAREACPRQSLTSVGGAASGGPSLPNPPQSYVLSFSSRHVEAVRATFRRKIRSVVLATYLGLVANTALAQTPTPTPSDSEQITLISNNLINCERFEILLCGLFLAYIALRNVRP